ncbi:MAG: GIY-YIG nuclease family protein, partial [Ferruginibacter sp.]
KHLRGCFFLFMGYMYILFSAQMNKYYVGSTSQHPSLRLGKHLHNHSGFTGKAKDWELKFYEAYETLGEAQQRERTIKSWKSAKRILALITGS